MNKLSHLLFVSTFVFGTMFAQKNSPKDKDKESSPPDKKPTLEKAALVEKTYSDLGKILDFKASLLSNKNLSSNGIENKLILESKGLSIELSKNEVREIINAMNVLNGKYFNSTRTSDAEISHTSPQGFEVGATFEVSIQKTSSGGGTTTSGKKEKFYVTTTEKYYEGKVVNKDAKGTFIWKEVSVEPETKNNTTTTGGKWTPFIRLHSGNSRDLMNVSTDEFKSLLDFLVGVSSKM